MKVLHIADRFAPAGGVETYLIELLPLLAEQGYESVVVYRRQHATIPAVEGEGIYYVPVTENLAADHEVIAGIVAQERPSLIYLHDVYDPHLMMRVSPMAPTISYVHTLYPVCPGLAKLFKRSNTICERPYGWGCVPMIYWQRCASARHPRSVYKIMQTTRSYLTAYQQLSRILVASNYMKELLVQNGIPDERVDILPYFIPIPDEADLIDLPPQSPAATIVFAGRLEYEKGFPYLLQALAAVKHPYRLLVAGDGTYREAYEQQAQALGIADRIEFLGWLGGAELHHIYQQSHLFVMTSIWPEPFGKVGVEALVRQRPVVAFDVGGVSDWLKHGSNGFLVPPGDTKQLALRIETLLTDQEKAAEFAANGRRYVQENYSSAYHMDRLLNIFGKELIN